MPREPGSVGDGAEGAPYRAPRLVCHGTLSDLTGSGEGTDLDGGAGFAFSGAEP